MGYLAGELDFSTAIQNLGKMPKQKQYLATSSFGAAYVAGEGSGKSVSLCMSAIMHGLGEPAGFSLLGRLNMPALTDTTMKTFLEMVPAEWGTWKEQKKTWEWANGHQTIFRHLDISEPEVIGHIKSLNLSFAGVDEASEINEKVMFLLIGRLRRKNVKTRFLRLASNPAGHDYMWRFFFDPQRKQALKDMYLGISASSMENVFLPAEYLEIRKNTYPADWADRYIYGHFSDFSDLVYKEFSEDTHVWNPNESYEVFEGHANPPVDWPVILGMDIGGGEEGDPWAIPVIAVAPNGILYQFAEVYGSDLRIKAIAEQLKPFTQGRNMEGMAYDYAQRAAAIELEEYDLWGQPAIKEVKPGLFKCAQYFHLDKTMAHPFNSQVSGSPRFFVSSACVNTIRELSGYKWAKDKSGNPKNEPAHENSHCPDAIRYAIHTFRPLPEKVLELQKWQNPALDEMSRLYWYETAKHEKEAKPLAQYKRSFGCRFQKPANLLQHAGGRI